MSKDTTKDTSNSPDLEYSDDKRTIKIDFDWKEYIGIGILILAISCTGLYEVLL